MKTIRPAELETAFVASDAPTLADVLNHVISDPDLSDRRRRDLASGVRRLAAVIGWPLNQAPADPAWLRPRVRNIAPAVHGLSPSRWSNIRSDAKAAMALCAIIEGRPSHPVPLREEWRALWDRLLATRDNSLAPALGRFVRFLSRLGVTPEQVGYEHTEAYRDAVALNELRKSPEDAMRAAVFGWNLAVDRLPFWPRQKLTLPSRSKVYAFPALEFPASFQSDLDRFLTSMSKPSPRDRDALSRPLRPATVRNRRAQVLRIASALVHSGMLIDSIRDLGVLVVPENAVSAGCNLPKSAV